MRYPVYVISKGRSELRHTVKALDAIGIPYHVVIEPSEVGAYKSVIAQEQILVLPFDNQGQGSIPARNWVWDHSKLNGHKRHWILDDNIRRFYRLHKNRKYVCTNDATFTAIENWSDRYSNVSLSGMQYELLAIARNKSKPIIFNTRIYYCILIQNNINHRWRGKYNEDTDLSLRCLKTGYCTALFVAFLADKIGTMTNHGGNTDDLYSGDGRLQMAQSLRRQHPDCVKVVRKWGRWQHQVDYRPFKANKLKRKRSVRIPLGINNYGMKLVTNG